MTSQAYAVKRAALNTVLARVERDGTIGPEQDLPGEFADTGELLAMAQQRWHSHLGARIDAALETGEAPSTAVGGAYREAIRSLPEIRQLLTSHAGHPALAAAREREFSLLAWAAGLVPRTTPASRAAELGREFADAVSAGVPTRRTAGKSAEPRGWLQRLKDVVAA
ncbi:MAG: hypothetical protein ACRDTM_17705 [Micromonosporaceae bacterium]